MGIFQLSETRLLKVLHTFHIFRILHYLSEFQCYHTYFITVNPQATLQFLFVFFLTLERHLPDMDLKALKYFGTLLFGVHYIFLPSMVS